MFRKGDEYPIFNKYSPKPAKKSIAPAIPPNLPKYITLFPLSSLMHSMSKKLTIYKK